MTLPLAQETLASCLQLLTFLSVAPFDEQTEVRGVLIRLNLPLEGRTREPFKRGDIRLLSSLLKFGLLRSCATA